jgi:hypothetical protein
LARAPSGEFADAVLLKASGEVPSILRQLCSLLLENSPVDCHEPLFNAGSSNIQPTLIRLWRDFVSIKQFENAFL